MAQSTRGRVRVANVKIYRPTHVPKELHGVWHGAAEFLAKRGRLLTASGKVNYPAINRAYQISLSTYGAIAGAVDKQEKKRTAGVTVLRPEFVPPALSHVWKQAAFLTAKKRRLLTASGKINYPAIHQEYMRGLEVFHRLASRSSARRERPPMRERFLLCTLDGYPGRYYLISSFGGRGKVIPEEVVKRENLEKASWPKLNSMGHVVDLEDISPISPNSRDPYKGKPE